MTERDQVAAHLKAALRHIGEAREDLGFAQELQGALTEDETLRVVEVVEAVASASRNIARALTSIEKPAAVNCPGCGGNGVALGVNPKVLKCEGCGGYYTREPIWREEATALVNLADMRRPRGAEERYFDFTIKSEEVGGKPYRTHGWFDVAGKFVVQFG